MNDNIWKYLFDDSNFHKEIEELGHSKERKFIDYLNKYDITLAKNGAHTAQNLSIDFYSKQSTYLTSKGFFIIRTGRGKFIIFDSKRFDKPYFDLKDTPSIKIPINLPSEANFILDIYKDNLVENASLELLHYIGGYKFIVENESKCSNYYIGPRGNTVSKFDVYFYDKKLKENKLIFQYGGQEDLDYSIVTDDEVFIIEAKSLKRDGFDLGFHKIAFPSNRFKNHKDKKIIPCYFLKHNEEILCYVFPEIKFHKNGIILNNKESLIPKKIYKLNLNELFNTTLSNFNNKITPKLVRDNILNIIKEAGKEPEFYIANKDEYFNYLIAKLEEEVNEFKEDHSIEELADIIEVVETIKQLDKYKELESIRKQKQIKNGGFSKKIILTGVKPF